MEPIALAANLVALLSPFVRKATEEFAGQAGAAAFEKTKSIFARLKDYCAEEPETKAKLLDFEKNPEHYSYSFGHALKERIEKDPDLFAELTQFIEHIQNSAPNVRVVQKINTAEYVVGIEAKIIECGTLTAEQDIKNVKNAVGIKTDKII